MNTHIKVVESPTEAERESVNVVLREFNRDANSARWAALDDPINNAAPLNLFVYSDESRIVGGLFAETQFHWLKIHIMAVEDGRRGRGLGSELMRTAEEIAVQRNCKYAFVDTMQYQAPEFYVKCGYSIVGTIPDWDSYGNAKQFLTKSLL